VSPQDIAPNVVLGSTAAVNADDLWRGYGRQRVLRGVSLTLRPGRCLAILGPNGSGKSTLLRVLAALLHPSRGQVRICGQDPFADLRARRCLGLVTHEPMLYGGLSVMENLRLLGTLYGLPDGAARASAVCDLLGIERRFDPVRGLSRGVQQRAALARALLHRPSVLLLDEPFSGLDPEAADALCGILGAFRNERGAVILTTHSPAEALSVADAAAALVGGQLAPAKALAGVALESLRAWYLDAAAEAGR
jgi:ABC-type multidrug transport system ATPase subunit